MYTQAKKQAVVTNVTHQGPSNLNQPRYCPKSNGRATGTDRLLIDCCILSSHKRTGAKIVSIKAII